MLFLSALLLPALTFAATPATGPSDIPLPTIPNVTFDVTKFGAIGDGNTDDTAHLQKAIDACAAGGGGTVLLPAPGVFLSNPLSVTAPHTGIRIDGTLLCMTHANYSDPKTSLITFNNSHDLEVSGRGLIEGQGGIGPGGGWWGDRTQGILTVEVRPRLVRFSNCDTVWIHDLTLKNSPSFHFIFNSTNNVTIKRITIVTPSSEETQVPPGGLTSHSTDAIDPQGSNYLIENCNISCGDDDVVFGSCDPISRNLTVRHCVIGYGHGISVRGGAGGVVGVTVSDCIFNGTTNGIRLKSNRGYGGTMQNLTFSNLKMVGVRFPLLFTSYYVYKSPTLAQSPFGDPPQPIGDHTPTWKNITVKNLTATEGNPKGVVGLLWGLPESPISDVSLINVHISAAHGLQLFHVRNLTLDEKTHFDVQTGNTLIAATDDKNNAPKDTTLLPDGFKGELIGSPTIPDDANPSLFDPNLGHWTLTCAGSGFGPTGDQFNFCAKSVSSDAPGDSPGDSAISIQLQNMPPPTPQGIAEAGPMFRAGLDPDAPFIALLINSNGQLTVKSRSKKGADIIQSPQIDQRRAATLHLKLTRTRSHFTPEWSPDGSTWTPIGVPLDLPALKSAPAGVAAASGADGQIGQAVFSGVKTTP